MAPSKWIPVRAIPSSLFSKLGHPIPLPSESYEPLVKSVLQHRLVHSIFLQSTILTWAAMTLSGIWQRYPTSITFDHIYKSSFNFVTILASLLVWVFAALPVIVLRRKLLTRKFSSSSSPRTRALTKKNSHTRPSNFSCQLIIQFPAKTHRTTCLSRIHCFSTCPSYSPHPSLIRSRVN